MFYLTSINVYLAKLLTWNWEIPTDWFEINQLQNLISTSIYTKSCYLSHYLIYYTLPYQL